MQMTISIKNLRLETFIGVEEWEKENKQTLVFNIELEFDATEAVKTDLVEQTVDYYVLTEKIIKAVEQTHFCLLESLANHILNVIMEDSRIKKATVEVDKPGALPSVDSVSVRCSAERTKESLHL